MWWTKSASRTGETSASKPDELGTQPVPDVHCAGAVIERGPDCDDHQWPACPADPADRHHESHRCPNNSDHWPVSCIDRAPGDGCVFNWCTVRNCSRAWPDKYCGGT